ncbi:MAG: hypothetical protein IPM47_14265 [Sphingobacteriales bacterium]|nr:MAG: hypothetical protein IPM47_14265 [Sphingobacteriales bacterium]
MKTAYIVLFLLILGVLGSIYAYRVSQTLDYVQNKGALPTVTEESYSQQKLYQNRTPQSLPTDTVKSDTTQMKSGQ